MMDISKEITMGADIGVMIAVGISAYVLGLNAKAFKLQKNSQQASLFNELIGNIHRVIDRQKEYEDRQKEYEDKKEAPDEEPPILHWWVMLFEAFEYFAFFANRGDLSEEMQRYNKSGIAECYQRANAAPEVRRYLSTRPEGQLNELKEYYKRIIGINPPF